MNQNPPMKEPLHDAHVKEYENLGKIAGNSEGLELKFKIRDLEELYTQKLSAILCEIPVISERMGKIKSSERDAYIKKNSSLLRIQHSVPRIGNYDTSEGEAMLDAFIGVEENRNRPNLLKIRERIYSLRDDFFEAVKKLEEDAK